MVKIGHTRRTLYTKT